MSLYAIVKGDIVDCVAISDFPLDTDGKWICIDGMNPAPGPYWTYIDGVFSPPDTSVKLPPIVTRLAFRFRLTDQEYIGILSAAKTDIEVASWVETFNMVSRVNLEDPRTVAGLDMMVSKSLLADQRKTEILTTPVKESEMN
jgi:hypothetical protein